MSTFFHVQVPNDTFSNGNKSYLPWLKIYYYCCWDHCESYASSHFSFSVFHKLWLSLFDESVAFRLSFHMSEIEKSVWEIIVKATLALISAFPYFTSRDYRYLTNQSTFVFLSTCLKLKKALPIRLYKTAGNCNVTLINVNILSCPSAKRYI